MPITEINSLYKIFFSEIHADSLYPFFYAGLSDLYVVMKAMPWVLKCVLRSAGLVKNRPHTLQVCFPSPSSTCDPPVLDGDPGDPAGSEVTFPGAKPVLGDTSACLAGTLRTRWLMKRCLLREEADAKHAPHCWHWKALPPSPRWQAMCCRNSSLSSVAKPHGMQRNPTSSWSSVAGSLLSATRLSASPRVLGPPSCSEELSAGSVIWGTAWKRFKSTVVSKFKREVGEANKAHFNPVSLSYILSTEMPSSRQFLKAAQMYPSQMVERMKMERFNRIKVLINVICF